MLTNLHKRVLELYGVPGQVVNVWSDHVALSITAQGWAEVVHHNQQHVLVG